MTDHQQDMIRLSTTDQALKCLPAAIAGEAVRWSALLLILVNVVGCNFLAPHYNRPQLPVADHYPPDTAGGSAAGLDAVASAATGWRDYFADERLRSLIEQALKDNRGLRSAVLRVEEARAQYGIQRAELFPTINAGANMARARTPGDLTVTGKPQTVSEYRVGLNSAAWEIDFWGRVRDLKGAALENYLATDASRRAVTVSLIADVADSYLRLRGLDERIILAGKTIATREESFRIFKRRFEVGATSRLDLTQVETLLLQAQALEAQLEQERAAEAHFLTLLVGAPVELVPAGERFDDLGVMYPLRVGLPSELLVNRPDIMAAEHQLLAAHANIGAARAAFFPRVTLIGSLGTASADLDRLFASGSLLWSYGPSISVPIFDAGRNRNNLNLAEVRRNLAVAGYEKTIQTAFREVSDALSAQKWLAEQARIQEATLAVQTERARLAKLRYDNGTAAFLEVLDAQRDLLSTEQELVQVRQALL